MKYRLGIDLGGTSVKLGLVNPARKIVLDSSLPSGGVLSAKELVKNIGRVAKPMMKGRNIIFVGVGVAGDIDSKKGIVRVSPNLNWKNVPLKSLLQKELGKPVVIDNDANVAAWGIYKTQMRPTVQHALVLTLGTGVGGGIILNGQVHRGYTGSAGEIGHMNMLENGRPCKCGLKGCLEAYAGGANVVKYAKIGLKNRKKSILNGLKITPLEISKAARKGDAYAKSIWEEVGHMLGIALGDLVYIFNPQIIVLAGGVAQAGTLITRPISRELKTRPFKTPVQNVKIRIAKKAHNVGIIGAALLAP